VDIHTSFKKEDIEGYYDKWYIKKWDFVSQDESTQWFETKLCGRISSHDLDH
jgi:hypothetical protein